MIKIVRKKISLEELKKITRDYFSEMVKVVVDIEKKIIAVGGELHADSEALLLENGSQSKNLWGANIYLNKPKKERIVFSALINVKPHQDNRSMEIEDSKIRQKVEKVINNLIP